MRKKMAVMLASAVAAGGISALTSVAHGAQVFTENFTSGDVTDGGIWSTGAVTNPANVSFTEPVGGPLTIGISPAAVGGLEGGYIQTTSLSTFDFTKSAMLATVTAPVVNGVQTSLAPPNGGGSAFTNKAFTYMGVDVAGASETTGTAAPGYTGASRLDTGSDKAYVAITASNTIEFSLEYFDPTPAAGRPNGKNNFINYTMYNRGVIPTGPNIDITSMFMYLDAADAANGNLWINFGATWLNTTTNVYTTDSLEAGPGASTANSQLNDVPFDRDPATGVIAYNDGNKANGYYGNLTPVQDMAIYSQFFGHVAGAVEVDNTAGDTVPGNSVSFGQLSVAVPEPTSFGLVAIGAGLLLRRKNRKA